MAAAEGPPLDATLSATRVDRESVWMAPTDKHTLGSVLRMLEQEKPQQDEDIFNDSKQRSLLKQSIVVEARRNALLEGDLGTFEKQIMLRLRERISDEELAKTGTQLGKDHELEITGNLADLLQRYGNLLFFIQQDPKYLVEMLKVVSGKDVDALVQCVVSTLFADSYDVREENRLLSIVEIVLEHIWERCSDERSFLRENSAAPKLLSAYARREPCLKVLKAVLKAPMTALLKQTNLNLEINPRKVLEQQLSKGKAASGLDDPEIQKIITERVANIIAICDSFLKPIYECQLPLGIQLISKILKDLVQDPTKRQGKTSGGGGGGGGGANSATPTSTPTPATSSASPATQPASVLVPDNKADAAAVAKAKAAAAIAKVKAAKAAAAAKAGKKGGAQAPTSAASTGGGAGAGDEEVDENAAVLDDMGEMADAGHDQERVSGVSFADSVVGGFVFLRYFTPAIINPNTVESAKGQMVASRVRRNMVIVAKVLQNLSNGILFGDKESFMMPLNSYLSDQFGKIKKFFAKVTNCASLRDHVNVEHNLELGEPFVYISVKEMLFVNRLLKEHIRVIAPAPTDPIHQVLKSLDEFEAPARDNWDKYVTLRLVDWMSGKRRELHSNSEESSDELSKIKSVLLDTMRTAVKQNYFHSAGAESKAATGPNGSEELDAATLQTTLYRIVSEISTFAERNHQNALVAKCKSAQEQLKRAKAEAIPALIERLGSTLLRRSMLAHKLSEEVAQLQTQLSSIRSQHDKLKSSVNTFKAYLKNIHDQTFYKLGWAEGGDIAQLMAGARSEEKGAELIESVLSVSALIGGLLSKVQRDVAEVMKRHLHDSSLESLYETAKRKEPHDKEKENYRRGSLISRETKVVAELDKELLFPRSCDFYTSALATFSTVGKCCIEDIISMLLATLPSMGKLHGAGGGGGGAASSGGATAAGAGVAAEAATTAKSSGIVDGSAAASSPSAASSAASAAAAAATPAGGTAAGANANAGNAGFSWGAFLQLIPNLTVAKATHMDVLDCVIDLMSVDIMTAVLQHYAGGSRPIPKPTVDKLVDLAFLHFKASQPRKLRKSMWDRIRQSIADQWAVCLGLLCPTHVHPVVHGLVNHFAAPALASPPQRIEPTDAQELLRGVRYVRFNPASVESVMALHDYVTRLTGLLDQHSVKGTFGLENQYYQTLQYCITLLDFTKCLEPPSETAPAPSGSGADAALASLSHTFYNLIVPLYYKANARALEREEVRGMARYFSAAVIMHAPAAFFDKQAEFFMNEHLTKDFGKGKKGTELKLILHFLRGGGGEFQIPRLAFVNDRALNKYTQVYGFGTNRLLEHTLKGLNEAIFQKRGVAKVAEYQALCERVVVQMAFHNFHFTVLHVLTPLCGAKGLELLVGLRALEILIDERSGFRDYCLAHEASAAAKARFTTALQGLSANFLPTVLATVKLADEQVGLRALGFNDQVTQIADHKLGDTSLLVHAQPPASSALAEKAKKVSKHHGATDVLYMGWMALDLYDVRTEDLLIEQADDAGSMISGLFKKITSSPSQRLFIEIYYHSLRLFPDILPEMLVSPQAGNCSLDGLFIGKLLVHPEPLISRTAYEGLRRTMMDFPEERAQVVQSFLHLIVNEDFQDAFTLGTLFIHLNALLTVWGQRLVVEHEKKLAAHKAGHAHALPPQSDDVKFGADVPSWFRWYPHADGVGLLYLSYPSTTVRLAAFELLRSVQRMQRIYYRIATGRPNPTSPTAMQSTSMHCVADVLDAHEDGIMKDGVTQASFAVFPRGSNILGSSLPMHSASFSQNAGSASHHPSLSVLSTGGGGALSSPSLSVSSPHHTSASGRSEAHSNDLGTGGPIASSPSISVGGGGMGGSGSGGMGGGGGAGSMSGHHHTPGSAQSVSPLAYVVDSSLGVGSVASSMPSFANVLKFEMGLVAHCVAVLVRLCVEHGRRHSLTHLREVCLGFLRRLPPSTGTLPLLPSDELKSYGKEDAERDKWFGLHAVYFASLGAGAVARDHLDHKEDPAARSKALEHIQKDLLRYLDTLWECLHSEVVWLRDALVGSLMNTHHECVFPILSHVDTMYRNLQKKKRKKALVMLTQFYLKLAKGIDFPRGLYDAGAPVLPIFRKFINETQKQLWNPVKLTKPKWQGTQVDLVSLTANVFCALNAVPDTHRKLFWDSNGALMDWDTGERYALFQWLLHFIKDAQQGVDSGTGAALLSAADVDTAKHRLAEVRAVCCFALKQLAGVGQFIPTDSIPNLLKDDIFPFFIRLDNDGYILLSVILCFHFRSLFPIFAEKVYSGKAEEGELYFRAIAEVFSPTLTGERRLILTTVQRDLSLCDMISPERMLLVKQTALASVGANNLGKLINLALMQMASPNVHTRFNAFEMIRSIATDFVSPEIGAAMLKYKFAFESQISSWARKYALAISQQLAEAQPSISFQVFREACSCVRTTPLELNKEWILTFLLPWADNIILSPSDYTGESQKESGFVYGNLHTSLSFLSQLWNIALESKSGLMHTLPIYQRLSKHEFNVAAILEFMVSRITDDTFASIDLCKNIIFTIYFESEHKDRILLSITQYLLRVLWQNADQISRGNLKSKLRSSQILSVLETHDTEASQGVFSIAHEFIQLEYLKEDDKDSDKDKGERKEGSSSGTPASAASAGGDAAKPSGHRTTNLASSPARVPRTVTIGGSASPSTPGSAGGGASGSGGGAGSRAVSPSSASPSHAVNRSLGGAISVARQPTTGVGLVGVKWNDKSRPRDLPPVVNKPRSTTNLAAHIPEGAPGSPSHVNTATSLATSPSNSRSSSPTRSHSPPRGSPSTPTGASSPLGFAAAIASMGVSAPDATSSSSSLASASDSSSSSSASSASSSTDAAPTSATAEGSSSSSSSAAGLIPGSAGLIPGSAGAASLALAAGAVAGILPAASAALSSPSPASSTAQPMAEDKKVMDASVPASKRKNFFNLIKTAKDKYLAERAANDEMKKVFAATKSNKEVEQAQSNVVAAMLVELIGVDATPVLPYFPVIVIYAVIHLNHENPFVRETMHKLLARIISGIGEPEAMGMEDDWMQTDRDRGRSVLQTLATSGHATYSNAMVTPGNPKAAMAAFNPNTHPSSLLSAALRAKSIQLIWDTEAATQHTIVSGRDTVTLPAGRFISEFCNQMERRKPKSVVRIGYEALRWAVLSTELTISKMAHIMYRSLLRPLNEASMHALMMSLLGNLEDWERSGWYVDKGKKMEMEKKKRVEEVGLLAAKADSAAASGASESGSDEKTGAVTERGGVRGALSMTADPEPVPGKEAVMTLDTLLSVAGHLMEDNKLQLHPSIFWCGVALLRCDEPAIYRRALNLLCHNIQGYSYLFSIDAGFNEIQQPSEGEDLLQALALTKERPDEKSTQMPEDFWSFSEKWSPRFDGIQPYVLPGMLSPSTESNSLQLMSHLTRVVWDPIIDSSQTRHLMTIIALLPWLYQQLASADQAASARVADTLRDLAGVIGRFSRSLERVFSGATDMAADEFLTKVCTELAAAYFPVYASPCADYLLHLLQSAFKPYHAVVLRITNEFLQHTDSIHFVKSFDEIISTAHDIVTKATGAGDEMLGSSASVWDAQAASAAADVVATVISLFNQQHSEADQLNAGDDGSDKVKRRGYGHSRHKSSSSLPHRALPIRSLHNAIHALRQVVRRSPMFSHS